MSETASGRTTGDDLIGRQIGQYEILRELGRGGMATVYLARQTSMNRSVAIKILPREFLHDPQFIERFKREVQLVADLEHPHILPVYDFGEIDRIPFIVMRYLGGGTLLDMVIDSLPPLETLVRPVEQVCSALDFAHGEGIIHRDLKPSNILLDERGNAYLSDFGIAQIMQDAGRLTGSAVIGTPAYMAPEQAEGRPLDARADVYALGVVLFELVTGREPFQADTPMAMLLKQITEPMPSPRAYRPDLPLAVEQVILRATMKDPGARYPSAPALAEAFAHAVRTLDPAQSSARLPRPAATGITRLAGQTDDAPTLADESAELPTVMDAILEDAPTLPPEDPGAVMAAVHATPASSPVSAPASGAQTHPARRASREFIWRYVAVVALVLAGTLGLLVLTRSPLIFRAPATPLPPTPFPGSVLARVLDGRAQLAVPEGWEQAEVTLDGAPVTLWAAPGDAAFVAVRQGAAVPEGDLSAAAAALDGDRYSDPRHFTPLDQATQPDGSLRHSYRVPQPEVVYDRFGRGQLDAFYRQAGETLLVVEFFTADDADSAALLPMMQQVLESFFAGEMGLAS